MNADYLTRLRKRLKRRVDRVISLHNTFYKEQLARLWHFIHNEPMLANTVARFKRTAVEEEQIQGRLFTYMNNPNLLPRLGTQGTEEDHIFESYYLLKRIHSMPFQTDFDQVVSGVCGNPTHHMRFLQQFLAPLCDFIDETLEEQQALFGLLTRYKRRSEWFNRDALFNIANKIAQSDAKKKEIERALKYDLHRYLDDQGIDFMIEPASPKGEVDLFLTKPNEELIECKVFDGKRRNHTYIEKGVRQTLRYLRQYNHHVGYCLIYKTCEKELTTTLHGWVDIFALLRHCDKTVYALIVDLYQGSKTASNLSVLPSEDVSAESVLTSLDSET